MAESVYRIIELVGTGTESWEKAAAAAVTEAAEAIRDLRIAEVSDLDMHIEEGKAIAYRAKVHVSFKVHHEASSGPCAAVQRRRHGPTSPSTTRGPRRGCTSDGRGGPLSSRPVYLSARSGVRSIPCLTSSAASGKIERGHPMDEATEASGLDQAFLERHRAFWRMEATPEPLLRVSRHVPLGKGGNSGKSLPRVAEGELIDPAHLSFEDPTAALPALAREGPLLREAQPAGVCWSEGFLGCPVRMETGGPWAEPFLHGRDAMRRSCGAGRLGANEAWLRGFSAATSTLVRSAAGRCAVTQALLRGPVDMMAAALGHEGMLTALLDYPEEAGMFLGLCTDLFIELAREHVRLVPPFHGGYSIFGVWSPVPAVRTQLDNAVLLSPAMYRDLVLPHDARVFREFPAVVIHVHSGCLHIVDELLGAPELTAIQVSIDFPGGPLARDILSELRRIQGRKPLIVTGPVTQEELDLLRRSVPPAGVAMDLQLVG